MDTVWIPEEEKEKEIEMVSAKMIYQSACNPQKLEREMLNFTAKSSLIKIADQNISASVALRNRQRLFT